MTVDRLQTGDITRQIINAVGAEGGYGEIVFLAHSLGLLQVCRLPGKHKTIDEHFGERFALKSHPPEVRSALKIERLTMIERIEKEHFNEVSLHVRQSPNQAFRGLLKEQFVGDDFFTDGRFKHFAEVAAGWVLNDLNAKAEQDRLDMAYAQSMAFMNGIIERQAQAQAQAG